MENIKGILVSLVAPMENHIANGGEKLLGNFSSIKRRLDERVYISGQMQRHAFFRAMERINWTDPERDGTYISNGDGIGNQIEVDLRADLGGFMHPSAGSYSGRRSSPLSVTPAVALETSTIGRDLLIRLKVNVKGEQVYSDGYVISSGDPQEEADDRKQALATREFSQKDLMLMNFFLDVGSLSISKRFTYGNGGFHVSTDFIKHVPEKERKRRVKLFLEATRSITDYANQARNAACGEPQKALIVFDTKVSRKASRFFQAEQKECINLLEELKDRKAFYVIGDDTNGEVSVASAYKTVLDLLANEKTTLFDPAGGDDNVVTFAEAFTLDKDTHRKQRTKKA